MREDPQLAMSMGINVKRLQLLSFVVSGLLAALGGGINALLRTTVSPDNIGFPVVVTALTMIIVGWSPVVAGCGHRAMIFTWLPNVLTVMASGRPSSTGSSSRSPRCGYPAGWSG